MNKQKTTDAMKLCMIVNILEGNPVAYKIKGNNMVPKNDGDVGHFIECENNNHKNKEERKTKTLSEDDIRRSIKELNHMSEWLDGMIYEDYNPLVCFAIGIALTSISTIKSQLRDMLMGK